MANETYTLIQRTTLTTSAASITLSNIPQTFTDLVVKISSRCDVATTQYNSFIRPNAATTGYREVAWYFYTTSILPITGANTSLYYSYAVGSTALANTFSSNEIYINNYSSTSLFKQFSIDSSVENNNIGTGYVVIHDGGTWASTSQMTSLYLSPEAGNYVAGTTVSLYGVAKEGVTPASSPKATGGDIITNDGTYWIHQFLNSGTFTPSQSLSTEYLVIAGGGGGGWSAGGGGGAGGYLTASGFSTTAQSYAITVGAGGTGGTNGSNTTSGTNSTYSSITSTGGGKGGSGGGSGSGNPGSGGSGGGGNGYDFTTGGIASPSGQGYAGGNGAVTGAKGVQGGGGGAGAVGANGVASTSNGAGGTGLSSSIIGTAITRAGGGGAGADTRDNSVAGAGGSGGGGAGSSSGAGTAATINTGGGGGGGAYTGTSYNGGAGGSGIVIIRYAM